MFYWPMRGTVISIALVQNFRLLITYSGMQNRITKFYIYIFFNKWEKENLLFDILLGTMTESSLYFLAVYSSSKCGPEPSLFSPDLRELHTRWNKGLDIFDTLVSFPRVIPQGAKRIPTFQSKDKNLTKLIAKYEVTSYCLFVKNMPLLVQDLQYTKTCSILLLE